MMYVGSHTMQFFVLTVEIRNHSFACHVSKRIAPETSHQKITKTIFENNTLELHEIFVYIYI